VIGLTSQRDTCSRANADWRESLRSFPEARGAPSSARPTQHRILDVPGTCTTGLGPTDLCPTTRLLVTSRDGG
jgi:hypothetical protein